MPPLDLSQLGIPGVGQQAAPPVYAPAAPTAPQYAPPPQTYAPAPQQAPVDVTIDLTGARAQVGSIYFTPGVYEVELISVKKFLKNNTIPAFAAKFKVLSSDNGTQPGAERDFYCDFSRFPDSARNTIASLCIAALGLDGAKPEVMAEVAPKLNAVFAAAVAGQLSGRKLQVVACTPKPGKKHTKHFFKPIPR